MLVIPTITLTTAIIFNSIGIRSDINQNIRSSYSQNILYVLPIRNNDYSNPIFEIPRITTAPQPTALPTVKTAPTIFLSPTPSIRSLRIPTAKPSTAPIPSPTSIAVFHPVNNIQNFIINEINKFRISNGLSSIKTDPYTCGFAKTRVLEITSDFSHTGFTNRVNNKTLPYPSYSLITENIALNSDYRDVVQSWINSPVHAENMKKDTPFVCVENSDIYYVYEGWKP
jgi:uncharacterized protein YkwD